MKLKYNSKKLIVFTLILVFLACSKNVSEPPVLSELPDFQLTNQNHQVMELDSLKGKVWVANFIFTSCAGTCPLLTKKMTRVRDQLAGKAPGPFAIVSFSVDPENDTPDRLAKYAKKHNAASPFWFFLTGPVDQVTDTVVKGFKISMGKVPAAGDDGEKFDVVHGEKFILVDEKGRIRGYYDSTPKGIKKLLADFNLLLEKVG